MTAGGNTDNKSRNPQCLLLFCQIAFHAFRQHVFLSFLISFLPSSIHKLARVVLLLAMEWFRVQFSDSSNYTAADNNAMICLH